jgi:hypothetical protein|tara:strand:- start:3057 stop:3338 length:282 start_codon:yes stop_codon:yes gene_type:complete
MNVKQIMGRVGLTETGRAIAYIEDALEEINVISETHIKNERINVTANKRFYEIPNDAIQLKEIRMKNHLNDKGEYRSIPRLIYKPKVKDADGV